MCARVVVCVRVDEYGCAMHCVCARAKDETRALWVDLYNPCLVYARHAHAHEPPLGVAWGPASL